MKTLNKLLLLASLTSLSFNINAQYVSNFTITDIQGQEYTLYDYLDNGIPVVLDMFSRY